MSSNAEQRDKALGKFPLVDDRMKLTNSLWAGCTQAAFSMGMTEDERMKLIAVNLVTQNTLLLNAIAEMTEAIDRRGELLGAVPDGTVPGEEFLEEIRAELKSYIPPITNIGEIARESQIMVNHKMPNVYLVNDAEYVCAETPGQAMDFHKEGDHCELTVKESGILRAEEVNSHDWIPEGMKPGICWSMLTEAERRIKNDGAAMPFSMGLYKDLSL